MGDPVKCEHKSFECEVTVNRIEDIGRFMADVRVKCVGCGTPFRFIGLPAGMDYNSPCVSVDACEARMPIAPKGEVLSELEGGPQGFSVRKVDRCAACGWQNRPDGTCTRPGCCNSD